jgi:hypothetical protein
VTALFANAVRERFADGDEGEPATVTLDSGPMHHFPEALSYAATEGTADAWFGALESLRRLPYDEPKLAWALAQRALTAGFAERRRRKAHPGRGSGGS